MDVNRINQGKIELRRERVDLATILGDAVEATRPLIDELGHELVLRLPPQALALDADATRLVQAFMNLLNNAAKYMDRGGRIEVAAQASEAEVAVRIRDSGIGIPPDRLDSVFEMFSQVETALARSRGGLGIGLSLTQRLVEMHGGSVKASSEGLGRGSEFSVRLPLAGPGADEPAHELAQAGAADRFGTGAPLRILIADDNQDAAATLALLFEIMGHSVQQAHDGEAAVKAAAEFAPQVVLLDIGMPKLNGYQACRKIRELPNGAAATLVAVTGWGQPGDRKASHEAGFDQHLVKPVDPAALADLLAEVSRRGGAPAGA
jgi:CheY-like chemotaxis protein/two-component sensor histidine kinase